MSDVAVVYWSDTGNTEAMAKLIVEGVESAGKTADLIQAADFSTDQIGNYSAIAFGCPAMGDEILEEDVFEPMFASVEKSLGNTKVALFGSYGWGDGQWMRDWVDRAKADGINLVQDLMANEYPDDDASQQCRDLGAKLAS